MRIHKSGQEIQSVEDRLKYAPPKLKGRHWDSEKVGHNEAVKVLLEILFKKPR